MKIIVSFLLALVLFSGCAIKKNDSTTTVILKHTVNTPIYLFMGSVIILNIIYSMPYYSRGHRIRFHSDYYSIGYRTRH